MKPGIAQTLFPEQVAALRRVHERDGKAGLFMEMGVGKSRVALVYTEYRRCRRVLVVCPISVVGVWERECAETGYSLPVIDLTSAGTVKDRAAFLRKTDSAIVLVNYESYWRRPLREQIDRWKPDAIILDEAHRIRHRGSRHSRFAHVLHDRNIPIRLALTGTPIVNGLQDAWSIYRFIDTRVFGERYADFALTYIRMGGYRGMEIKGYQNVERANSLIAATSFQAAKRADLPERQDIPVPIRLTPRTQKVYDDLKADAIVRVTSADGQQHTVLARIALTLLLRLQQITSGFVRGEGEDADSEIVTISDEKVSAALEIIDDAVAQGQKVVVFARFLHDVDSIRDRLPSSIRAAVFTGRQTSKQRSQISRDFHAGKYDVIVSQIKASALGIDLTPANVAIFTSIGFSLDDFLQAKDRLHRYGQTRPVSYYHLLARGTVDEKVYAALRGKMSIASRVTDLTYALDLFR